VLVLVLVGSRALVLVLLVLVGSRALVLVLVLVRHRALVLVRLRWSAGTLIGCGTLGGGGRGAAGGQAEQTADHEQREQFLHGDFILSNMMRDAGRLPSARPDGARYMSRMRLS